jgi:hypothetical protein
LEEYEIVRILFLRACDRIYWIDMIVFSDSLWEAGFAFFKISNC